MQYALKKNRSGGGFGSVGGWGCFGGWRGGCFVFGAEADASEIFGVFAFDVFVKGADDVHVCAEIIGGGYGGAEATDLFFEVEEAEDDGYVGFFGDVVEARLPIVDVFSRTFSGDSKDQGVDFLELFGGGGDDVVVGAAVDGDTAHPAHKPAVGKAKEGVFAHPRDFDIKVHRHDHHVDKVPIGRMRGGDQNQLFSGQRAFSFPSREFE